MRKWRTRFGLVVTFVGLAGVASACGMNSAKNHYLLGERLWSDGKYAAAVAEFDKAAARDPQGKLGFQSLFRSAMTQSLFLSQYPEAIRKFRLFAEKSPDAEMVWEAQKQAGEILYSKLEQYDQAILHYEKMLSLKPNAPEAPELLFRIGRSRFFVWKFSEAIQAYREVLKKFPRSEWAEKAAFEIGVTYFTRGEQHPESKGESSTESYQNAFDAYEDFVRAFPKSTLVPEARFGMAFCLEEMDQLDAAYHAYEALRTTYPSPRVIEIKLARIRERKAHRSR